MSKGVRAGRGRVAITGLLLAWGTTAAATAAGGEISEEDFLLDPPVVLSATRLHQPRAEAPVAVTVIDREMITASGAQDIHELLELAPGFIVARFNGHTPAITNYGLSDRWSRRLQVLVDGRSVYTPLWGGVPWSDLPLALEDIERIEVIHGPNSATYGSNAFLGVISITTRHPAQDRGTFAKAVVGNAGRRRALLRYGGASGDLDYRLTVGYRDDSGLESRFDGSRAPLVTGRADYRAGNGDRWEFQLGYSGGTREEGLADDVLEPFREKEVNSHFQMVRWSRPRSADDELSLQLSHTYHDVDDRYRSLELGGFGSAWLERRDTNRRFDLEFQQRLAPSDRVRVAWGLGARLDRAREPLYLGTDEVRENEVYRLFGNLEWAAGEALNVNLGAMAEENDLGGGHLSPRLALNYRAAPGHVFRATLSSAVRAPTFVEAQSDAAVRVAGFELPFWRSDLPLESERITTGELGYVAVFEDTGLELDLRLFHHEIRDLIAFYYFNDPINKTPPEVFRNAYDARISGFQWQLGWRPDRRSRLVVGHSYQDIEVFSVTGEYDRGYGDKVGSTVPQHTFNLLASRSFPGKVKASVGLHYLGALLYLGDGDRIKSHSRLDLRLSKGFDSPGGTGGEVSLVMRGVNGRYQDFRELNLAEPAVYLELSASFD